ncbi:hypothetical protein MVEG_02608 [Podila verticillata NRRL 6337]|nr:hypothetical protein MVEG_02608 [Podila verticillata NRRL 6337]
MQFRVIASVDETQRQNSTAVLTGDRDSTPSARPILYISREQCLQHKLRNAVVALRLEGGGPAIYASVKIYSKESAIFRKDNRYPEKLVLHTTAQGVAQQTKMGDVIATNLLWWELKQARQPIEPFREESEMEGDDLSICIEAQTVTNLGNVVSLSLCPGPLNSTSQPILNGGSISQLLAGSIASLNGWISFKSPHGMQMFKVTRITTTSNTHPDVGIISESALIHYEAPGSNMSVSSVSSTGALASRDLWLSSIQQSIGGYDDILAQMINHIYGFIQSTFSEDKAGDPCFRAPFKGILISGRPGTGKSALASSLAEYSGLPYGIVNCPDVFQTDAGASENYLRNAFKTLLSRHKASILILDEVDMIASGRASRKGVEAKLFATLLNLIDSINLDVSGHKIVVVALTNRLHAVDSSLIRSGRLDKVFDLHLKGVEQRLRVLEILSKDLPIDPTLRPIILKKVARATHGFVPTDLQALCTESALQLIAEMSTSGSNIMTTTTPTATIDFSYFERALKTIRPSGMGEYQTKIPTVTFDQLYGIQEAITDLRISIIEPFNNPQKYIDLGISPPRGVIVHGPPGVGKTMLCCALAEELGINFMLVESSQIRSKVVGESEQNIARMFAQAKANAPCILFIDQIDVLAPARGTTHTSENSGDRIVTSLLTEMDGFFTGSSGKSAEVDVLVLAATNRPEVIDAAILRPGRLDQIVYIPVPDLKTRKAILEGYMAKMPMSISPEEVARLSENTVGFSGADLENMCREAALICLRQDIQNKEIAFNHLQAAKNVSKPSLLGYKDEPLFSR